MSSRSDHDLVLISSGGEFIRSDFLIARHPVTVRSFRSIVRAGAASPAASTAAKLATWDEAVRYCNLLSMKAGRPPAYDEATGVLINELGIAAREIAEVRGFRCPTGAEWRYAACGGRPDPPYADWGAVLDRIYWDDPTSHRARPVAPKEPVTNALGLVGLLGFVREWCSYPKPDQTCRNRVCGWSHHFTNYDLLVAYHVADESAVEGATYPFRIALTSTR